MNAEHRSRISELIELNASHEHLMVSSQVAMLALTTTYHIERFTAAAQKWLDWQPTDVGRNINELRTSPLLETIKAAVDHINAEHKNVLSEPSIYKQQVSMHGFHYEVQARQHTQSRRTRRQPTNVRKVRFSSSVK